LEAKFETLANHARDSKDVGNEPLFERLEPKVASLVQGYAHKM
jgi:hypothetical protein